MPDRDAKTIRDLIYYQYAKLIARSATLSADGKEAKRGHYGLIKKTFRDLKSGAKSWSDITREDWQLMEGGKVCAYCGITEDLHREHIVPKSIKIKPECETCDHIQKIHNQVWACRNCNLTKGTLGLYDFYHNRYPDEPKYYDLIPPLLEKKYLKTIFNCHECAGTLDKDDLNADGELSVLDIEYVFKMAR